MPGTLEGGKLAAQTNITKHGADFYGKIGAVGGRNSRGYKFAHGKADPSELGKRGGTISRRGYTDNPKAATIKQRPKYVICSYCAVKGHKAYSCDLRISAIRTKRLRDARRAVIAEEQAMAREKNNAIMQKWAKK